MLTHYCKFIHRLIFLMMLVALTRSDRLWSQFSQPGEKITVALTSFENKTELFFYDQLEATLPEMLKTEMARSDRLIVLERFKLDAILAEQALAQTGLIDPETAQTVGRLTGAQFIITGEINKINNRLRIDAHIIRVASGQVLAEKVTGKDLGQIDDMLAILANNIVFSLTGVGNRIEKQRIEKFPTRWFLATGAVVGVGALYAQSNFSDKHNSYKSARNLSDIQVSYDRANQAYQLRNWLFSASSSLLITGVVFFLLDQNDDRLILAHSRSKDRDFFLAVAPRLDFSTSIGVRLCFGF